MLKNSVFQGKVRDLSSKGLGVVDHPHGLVFFIPGVWPGDFGEFQITSVEKRYGYARLVRLIEKSLDRVEPPCPHHGFSGGFCGGCPWMIGSYESQLKYKQKFLEYQVQRAKISHANLKINSILGSSQTLGYRNRAQLKTDGQTLGFVSVETNQIAPIQDCLVLSKKNRNTLQSLIKQLPNENWNPKGAYKWNFFDIDEQMTPSDLVLNRRRPFQQGNTEQNTNMKKWLKQQLETLDPNAPLLELFCGSGNFTEVISGSGFKNILALEVNHDSILELQNKRLPGVTARVLNLEQKFFWKDFLNQSTLIKYLVLDPPRTGFEKLVDLIRNLPCLEKIFYISCDVSTYLRDTSKLLPLGWKAQEIQPLDQFPHTTHTELLTLITK